jgi:hypothetical protein
MCVCVGGWVVVVVGGVGEGDLLMLSWRSSASSRSHDSKRLPRWARAPVVSSPLHTHTHTHAPRKHRHLKASMMTIAKTAAWLRRRWGLSL